ncbi:Minf_1886 family protein [Calycomorphotria hydatis]|uniref:Uncharacterized protein n=1 Tax=Calycomorphotria hydatis TaxID=2528027 RepID=A0A517T821_9PLAN|nr:Minf_1886 family protein [Calycomorphotria hydatis]QDT64523.1 hypothetical protein V22_17580 [Calycomorphotria hydatis]
MSSITDPISKSRLRYHRNAYHFVFSALQYTQEKLERTAAHVINEEDAHISGQELCDGLRELAIDKFGLLASTVLSQWGIESTDDIGRIVFELIERGEMRKTDRDTLTDFMGLYEFSEVFDQSYAIDTTNVFEK